MAKEKQITVLTNGDEVATTSIGWDKVEVSNQPALMAGWKSGASHHSISLGFALACKDKVPGAFLGMFPAENEKGEIIEVPVFDPGVINEAIQDAAIKEFDLDVKTIRIAGNRSGAKKSLNEIAGTMNAETLEALKAVNPELAEKLSKLTG